MSFISSERPLEENVAKLVEQAAVRSLSCEVVPGKEGKVDETKKENKITTDVLCNPNRI